ncbi:MAG: hypothetical protein Alpg2KO_09030 [Alphaproteobacteria bacterium]
MTDDVIEGAYLALLPSPDGMEGIGDWSSRLPDGVDCHDRESWHLTVRGGPVGVDAGRFGEAHLSSAGRLQADLEFERLKVLWGQRTGFYYVVLVPSASCHKTLIRSWQEMGQTRTDFRIHLSLGRFTSEVAQSLVPEMDLSGKGEPGAEDMHRLTQAISGNQDQTDPGRCVFGQVHLSHFLDGVPLAEQQNFYPIYQEQGWNAFKQAYDASLAEC